MLWGSQYIKLLFLCKFLDLKNCISAQDDGLFGGINMTVTVFMV